MRKIWHKTVNGDYPTAIGGYAHKNYPQIPCLCINRYNRPMLLCYNVTEDSWDDEEGDDYYCNKEDIALWAYIDDIRALDNENKE